MAKMTLIGMYEWDNTLFENLTFPEGIDKQTAVDNILLRSGDFEVIYPDFDFLKFSIGAWSRKYQPTFVRWINVLNKEYNPIENYDRQEHWEDSGSSKGFRKGSASGNTSGNTRSTNTDLVSAYDAGDNLTTKGQNIIAGNDTSNSSSNSSEDTSGTTNGTHDGRVHGNIGVMSSQDMINQELDLAYRNVYNMITELFLTEFVLPIY